MRGALKDAAIFCLLIVCADAFYLPGTAPKDYREGEPVELLVNALTPMVGMSNNGKLKSLINYDYYNPSFHFCTPLDGIQSRQESLGAILFGDRIFNSPYEINMLQDDGVCKTLCEVTVSPEEGKFINDRIREDYALNWLIDGLPAAEMKREEKTGDLFFDMGFNLGNDEEEQFTEIPALNNHYEIVLRYHNPTPGNYRIVGVLVWPISNGAEGALDECQDLGPPLILSESSPTTFKYTYRVRWNESSTPWATRWDNYLHIFDPRIHWFSLINSTIIVFFLCFMVAMILWRNVSKDIARYNAIDLSEDVQEDYGWKLVHGEVFRPPKNPMMLSVISGNGAQLCAMSAVTLVFALFGFLSPSNRGSLATVMIICWTFFGSIGGYVSSRVFASLSGQNIIEVRRNALYTATLLPVFTFSVVFFLNFLLITAGSSGAVPFGTMVSVLLLWFGVSAPLSFVGSYFGFKHGGVSHPTRVNPIPRQIPPVPKYLKPWWAAILSGILPFGAAFVELYFVLSSLFASKVYYAFGFLALTASIVALTTATVTILFTYFNLCAEEYRWHWRAFLTGGGSAFWLLIYGIYYWISGLSLHSFSNVVLYFGYLILLVLFDFLATGTIGFVATYWAMRRLYSAIRVD